MRKCILAFLLTISGGFVLALPLVVPEGPTTAAAARIESVPETGRTDPSRRLVRGRTMAEVPREVEQAEPEPPEVAKADAASPEQEDERSLRLLLDDADTGRAVSMWVRLWRLGAPETEEWTRGDHVARKLSVGSQGVVLEGLAAGRYRLQCDGQRRSATDPPEFWVTGRTTAFTARLLLPKAYRARLVVFGEDGRRIELGRLRSRGSGSSHMRRWAPKWAAPRRRKGGKTTRSFHLGSG